MSPMLSQTKPSGLKLGKKGGLSAAGLHSLDLKKHMHFDFEENINEIFL